MSWRYLRHTIYFNSFDTKCCYYIALQSVDTHAESRLRRSYKHKRRKTFHFGHIPEKSLLKKAYAGLDRFHWYFSVASAGENKPLCKLVEMTCERRS